MPLVLFFIGACVGALGTVITEEFYWRRHDPLRPYWRFPEDR